MDPKGLCTRREGYPSKRVKVSSGLPANFTGRVTLSPGSTSSALHCSDVYNLAQKLDNPV